MNFIPDNGCKAAITIVYKKPTLYFTPTALEKTRLYVESCDTEIGWLGEIEPIGNDFLCKDVYLPEQDVHSATTEMQPDDLIKFASEHDDELMEKLCLWGHSHVNMGTSPSGQDDNQVDLFRDTSMQHFFRVIANKKGELNVTYYDAKNSITVTNSAWALYSPCEVDEDAVRAEVKSKLREKKYTTYTKDTITYPKSCYDYDDYDGWNYSRAYKDERKKIAKAESTSYVLDELEASSLIWDISTLPKWIITNLCEGKDMSYRTELSELADEYVMSYDELATFAKEYKEEIEAWITQGK